MNGGGRYGIPVGTGPCGNGEPVMLMHGAEPGMGIPTGIKSPIEDRDGAKSSLVILHRGGDKEKDFSPLRGQVWGLNSRLRILHCHF
jgi:hypothetical protein